MNLRLKRRIIGVLGPLAFVPLGCALEGAPESQATEAVTLDQTIRSATDVGDDTPEQRAFARTRCPRDLPPALAPPPDATLVTALAAKGVQIYACTSLPIGAAPVWTLKAPHAILNKGADVLAIHFTGPSWQATDGSLVTGQKVASAPSPDATAIPWLLLSASSNVGTGIFGDITFIQRLNTEGGAAPTSGCDAAHLDAQVLVPYRADYFFYHSALVGEAVRQCASP